MIGRLKIGVITPMYNSSKTIVAAMDSVQKQQGFSASDPYKIVHYIYDDKSTDDSTCTVMKYILENDIGNIKIFYGSVNKGQSEARNVLIKKALYEKCDIIAFLDADDEWSPEHFRVNIGMARLHNCFVYSKPVFFQDGCQVFPVNIPVPEKFDGNQFRHNNFIWISSVIADANLFVGEEFDSSLNSVEDWDFWHRMYLKSSKMKIDFIDNGTTTVRYNVNPNGQAGKSAEATKMLKAKHGWGRDMKIRVIACCKNEEDMLPFFLQYYSSFADEILIFDGGSTDRSHEIISKYPKAKLLIKYDEKLNDGELMWVRNEAYKQGREHWDWQIVCDIDEFLYYKHGESLWAKLHEYRDLGVTLPSIVGYDMYDTEFPEYSETTFITDQVRYGKRNDQWNSKNMVFNPKKVDINYEMGCHSCKPSGTIVVSQDRLVLLHYNHVGYHHFHNRYKYNASRISDFNKEHGFGFHIPLFASITEFEFNAMVNAVQMNSDKSTWFSTWQEN